MKCRNWVWFIFSSKAYEIENKKCSLETSLIYEICEPIFAEHMFKLYQITQHSKSNTIKVPKFIPTEPQL